MNVTAQRVRGMHLLRGMLSAALVALLAACGDEASTTTVLSARVDSNLSPTGAWRLAMQETDEAGVFGIEVMEFLLTDPELRVVMRRYKNSGWVDEQQFDFRTDDRGQTMVEPMASTFNAHNPSDIDRVRGLHGTITINSPLADKPYKGFVFEYKLRGSQGGSPVDIKGKIVL